MKLKWTLSDSGTWSVASCVGHVVTAMSNQANGWWRIGGVEVSGICRGVSLVDMQEAAEAALVRLLAEDEGLRSMLGGQSLPARVAELEAARAMVKADALPRKHRRGGGAFSGHTLCGLPLTKTDIPPDVAAEWKGVTCWICLQLLVAEGHRRVAELEAETAAMEATLGAVANALGVTLADRPEGIEAAAKAWRERAEAAEDRAAARFAQIVGGAK